MAILVKDVDEQGRNIIENEEKIKLNSTMAKLAPNTIEIPEYLKKFDSKYLEDAVESADLCGVDQVIYVIAHTKGDVKSTYRYTLASGIVALTAAIKSGKEKVLCKVMYSHKVDKCGNPLMVDEMRIRDLIRSNADPITLTESIFVWIEKVLDRGAEFADLSKKDKVEIIKSFNHKNPRLSASEMFALREGFKRIGNRSITSFMKNNLPDIVSLPDAIKTAIKEGKVSMRDIKRPKGKVIPEVFKPIMKTIRAVAKSGVAVTEELKSCLNTVEQLLKKYLSPEFSAKSA